MSLPLISLLPLFLFLNNPNPHTPILEHTNYVEAGLQRCIISNCHCHRNSGRGAGWPGQSNQEATALLGGICCLLGYAPPTHCAWRLTQVTPLSWRLWCCLLTHSTIECTLTDTSYLPSLANHPCLTFWKRNVSWLCFGISFL